MRIRLLIATALIASAISSPAAAQIGFNASSEGSITVGYDSRTCDSTIEGAIRYNSASQKMQVCASQDSCPVIGDDCSDGSVFAGLSPDGNVRMYTTPADAGQFSWNDGTTNYVELAMQNCFSISPGAQASCQTGEANTALLVALGTTPSPAPYVAARHCDNLDAHGQTDWHLPSQDELHVLYVSLVDQNSDNTPGGPLGSTFGFNVSGSFPAGYYWSSSENGSGFARGQRFSDGFQSSSFNKNGGLSVRCVRKSISYPISFTWRDWGG